MLPLCRARTPAEALEQSLAHMEEFAAQVTALLSRDRARGAGGAIARGGAGADGGQGAACCMGEWM